jgi:hypothetical protein
VDTAQIRNNYFDTESMKYILINGNINKVLGFLHKADYYQKFEAK